MGRGKSIEAYDNEIKRLEDQILSQRAKLTKQEDKLKTLVDNRKEFQAEIVKNLFMQSSRSFEEAMNFFKCPGL
jgi:predicted  nucleic acid-binding Zn-ribbon protein